MRSKVGLINFLCEAVIFIYPLITEVVTFCSAILVKTSNPANGGQLLILLAVVKLASSILEYKGFEEAYLLGSANSESAFRLIGLFQVIQGLVLPALIIVIARNVLLWNIDPLFASLLLWIGSITSLRQFLAYRWRSKFKPFPVIDWEIGAEVVLAHAWLALIATTAIRGDAQGMLPLVLHYGWILWVISALGMCLWQILRKDPAATYSLSLRQWAASIGQASASQLGKEFFILVSTTNVLSGFIARVAVTAYGLAVIYPVSFLRIRIFDKQAAANIDRVTAAAASDSSLRKSSSVVACGLLVLSIFGSSVPKYTGMNFPFTAALLALAIASPIAAYDALSYFHLLQKRRRGLCSVALIAGGTVAIAFGFLTARSSLSPAWLAFSLLIILGASDFVVNKVSKFFALH